jgi:hypothetical protein
VRDHRGPDGASPSEITLSSKNNPEQTPYSVRNNLLGPSGFLRRHAQAFLNPIFASKTRMAQYHGVTEAACRVHDERIGVGRVFHLYRLPETIEQRIPDAFQEESLPENVTRCFESSEAAESALAGLAKEPAAA